MNAVTLTSYRCSSTDNDDEILEEKKVCKRIPTGRKTLPTPKFYLHGSFINIIAGLTIPYLDRSRHRDKNLEGRDNLEVSGPLAMVGGAYYFYSHSYFHAFLSLFFFFPPLPLNSSLTALQNPLPPFLCSCLLVFSSFHLATMIPQSRTAGETRESIPSLGVRKFSPLPKCLSFKIRPRFFSPLCFAFGLSSYTFLYFISPYNGPQRTPESITANPAQ